MIRLHLGHADIMGLTDLTIFVRMEFWDVGQQFAMNYTGLLLSSGMEGRKAVAHTCSSRLTSAGPSVDFTGTMQRLREGC